MKEIVSGKDLVLERALEGKCPICNEVLKKPKKWKSVGYKDTVVEICEHHGVFMIGEVCSR